MRIIARNLRRAVEAPFGSQAQMDFIRGSFSWAHSPQGTRYWADVVAGKNTNEAEIMQNLREIYAQYLMEKDL